jgi:glycosyltransferase involved in cell wall biosynthesis
MLVDALEDATGGGERFAVGLATALPNDRFEVWLCTTRGAEGELLGWLREAGVRHFDLGRKGPLDLLRFARLVRFLRDQRIDLLHSHKFGSNLWGAVFGRLSGVPVIVAHEQTWSYEGHPVRRLLDRWVIAQFADRFVSVSTRDRERMISVERVPEEKTLTIPNAYIPRPKQDVRNFRAELSISPDAPVVGTVCALRPQKALEVLIEAFAQVARKHPTARLVIVGDGPRREPLERYVAEAELEERVFFPGTRTNLASILRGFDVAAMSSDFEGTPLFALECMAHHTPLVATRVGGLPDLIESGREGILVPPRDPGALAAGIDGLIRDPSWGQALASAAAERLQDFTIGRIAERFAGLYDDLLARV